MADDAPVVVLAVEAAGARLVGVLEPMRPHEVRPRQNVLQIARVGIGPVGLRGQDRERRWVGIRQTGVGGRYSNSLTSTGFWAMA